MSSSALKIAALILAVLTLVLAGLGFAISRNQVARTQAAEQAAAKAEAARREAQKAQAVIAIRPIAALKPIGSSDVALVPVAVVPSGYFAAVNDVVGRIPVTAIDVGQPVTQRQFEAQSALVAAIPAGTQALAMEVNEIIASGGFLKPGDVVDLLLFLRPGPGVEEAQARVLLSAVRVLAYEDKVLSQASSDAATDSEARRRIRTAVLAIPNDEINRVLVGIGSGDVRLSLRGKGSVGETPAPAKISELAIKPPPPPPPPPLPPPPPEKPKPVTVEVLRGATTEQVVQ